MVADGAEAFADALVKLYQDEVLWNHISHNGLEFAENAWGSEAAWHNLADILVSILIYLQVLWLPIDEINQSKIFQSLCINDTDFCFICSYCHAFFGEL